MTVVSILDSTFVSLAREARSAPGRSLSSQAVRDLNRGIFLQSNSFCQDFRPGWLTVGVEANKNSSRECFFFIYKLSHNKGTEMDGNEVIIQEQRQKGDWEGLREGPLASSNPSGNISLVFRYQKILLNKIKTILTNL